MTDEEKARLETNAVFLCREISKETGQIAVYELDMPEMVIRSSACAFASSSTRNCGILRSEKNSTRHTSKKSFPA